MGDWFPLLFRPGHNDSHGAQREKEKEKEWVRGREGHGSVYMVDTLHLHTLPVQTCVYSVAHIRAAKCTQSRGLTSEPYILPLTEQSTGPARVISDCEARTMYLST